MQATPCRHQARQAEADDGDLEDDGMNGLLADEGGFGPRKGSAGRSKPGMKNRRCGLLRLW